MPKQRGRFVPISWFHVGWSKGYVITGFARAWCRTNVGVERADWEYQPVHARFRFRSQEDAMLFRLTWA